jgi:hypothetical protein
MTAAASFALSPDDHAAPRPVQRSPKGGGKETIKFALPVTQSKSSQLVNFGGKQ